MFSNPWQNQSPPQFLLQNLPEHPYQVHLQLRTIYEELNECFIGEKLIKFDFDQATERRIELYSARINPQKSTTEKYVTILFGKIPSYEYFVGNRVARVRQIAGYDIPIVTLQFQNFRKMWFVFCEVCSWNSSLLGGDFF